MTRARLWAGHPLTVWPWSWTIKAVNISVIPSGSLAEMTHLPMQFIIALLKQKVFGKLPFHMEDTMCNQTSIIFVTNKNLPTWLITKVDNQITWIRTRGVNITYIQSICRSAMSRVRLVSSATYLGALVPSSRHLSFDNDRRRPIAPIHSEASMVVNSSLSIYQDEAHLINL